MKPLQIPKIKQSIAKAHTEFMDNFGPQIEKVMVDHRLQAEMINVRLLPIMICLKEEGVIDDFVTSTIGYNKKIQLLKNGYDSYVNVTTNGLQISLEGYGNVSLLGVSDFAKSKELLSNVHEDEFDWTAFSMTLLDYIHRSIYERQNATEIKLEGMLKTND